LRWGVYVTFEAPSDYVRDCFAQYGLKTDSSGRYATMYKPYHLIGLELGISVANIAVRGEATGNTMAFRGDTVATAKRDLKAGEKLDGEGGYMVYRQADAGGRFTQLRSAANRPRAQHRATTSGGRRPDRAVERCRH